MGMFDTVYAELDCPFCGRQYRYSPMSWGVCADSASPRAGLLMFEHQGCEQFEG
jgi:hypothetical protein